MSTRIIKECPAQPVSVPEGAKVQLFPVGGGDPHDVPGIEWFHNPNTGYDEPTVELLKVRNIYREDVSKSRPMFAELDKFCANAPQYSFRLSQATIAVVMTVLGGLLAAVLISLLR